MGLKSIWTEETYVKTFETDFQQRWKPSGFFQAMQEAAAHHASSFGFDSKDMLAQDKIWVLSRVKIYFSAFPEMGEKVTIRTWPKGIQQRIFFMRDFQIFGENGRDLATATSAWLLIKPSSRRILLPQELNGTVPDNDGLSAFQEALDKIPTIAEMQACFIAQAGYSSIDVMGHVTNSRYIDWISDCFPFEQYRAQKIDWLQINFTSEVRPAERVPISAGKDPSHPDTWYLQGTHEEKDTRAFEAALHWS
jgi:medium-chain acyl-[acyl-carrier-protein] hydrolase